MRLHLAFVAVFLAACTQPTLSNAKPGAAQAGASAEAGSGARDGKQRSQSPSAKRGEDAAARDAGAARATAEDEMDQDAGEPPSTGKPRSAGTAGAGGGTATGGTGGSGAAAMPAMGDIVGDWSGKLEDALDRGYTACLHVTQVGMQGPAGDSYYTGALNCVGRLTYKETMDGVHSFMEAVISGAGCPPGLLTLTVTPSGSATYNWYLNQGAIPEATGTLMRTDACP